MSGGGSRKGERRGGRKVGTPNRATLERALIAEREMAQVDKRATKSFKLGKEVLRDFMEAFGGLATHYQPVKLVDKDGKPVLDAKGVQQLRGDLEQFGRWSELAVKCAIALAPYESPRLNAITVVPPAPEQKKEEEVIEVKVFEADGSEGKVIQLIPPGRTSTAR